MQAIQSRPSTARTYPYTLLSTALLLLLLQLLLLPPHSRAAPSRAYPQGCSREPPSFYDYDSYPLPPDDLPSRSHDDFQILRRLGAGKFSDVFEAVDVGVGVGVGVGVSVVAGTTTAAVEDRDSRKGSRAGVVDGGVGGVGVERVGVDPAALCVIKCLKPVSERRIKRELLVLAHASKLPNLARLRGVVLSQDDDNSHRRPPNKDATNTTPKKKTALFKEHGAHMPSLVLEHAGPNSRWLCHGRGCDASATPPPNTNTNTNTKPPNDPADKEPLHLTEYEIKYYLCHLLVALDALHSRGIMHRDIKPRNVLINRRWPPPRHPRRYPHPPVMLIDLGLADFYLPHQKYNVRVASRHYKSPELLVGHEYYDYGLDMWGVGCILGGLLLRREPFFRGKDNIDQLGKIVAVLGCHDLLKYCDKNAIQLSDELNDVVRRYTMKSNFSGKRKSWLTLMGLSSKNADAQSRRSTSSSSAGVDHRSAPLPSNEGIHLLDNLLVYDHDRRLTAQEAMAHPFFDEVRGLVEAEVRLYGNLEQEVGKKV